MSLEKDGNEPKREKREEEKGERKQYIEEMHLNPIRMR
jgi:hypothetical protein